MNSRWPVYRNSLFSVATYTNTIESLSRYTYDFDIWDCKELDTYKGFSGISFDISCSSPWLALYLVAKNRLHPTTACFWSKLTAALFCMQEKKIVWLIGLIKWSSIFEYILFCYQSERQVSSWGKKPLSIVLFGKGANVKLIYDGTKM